MKTEKIEELFEKHLSTICGYADCYVLFREDFADAINQAELEWYKKLDSKLDDLTDYDSVRRLLDAINRYQAEIQEKIKELEK